MAFGPTQNYDDASLGVWKGRPVLAALVRALVTVAPVALAVGLGLAAVHWFPPSALGVNPWLWLLVEVACATTVLVLATRVARSFIPVTTMLRLTLYFPDRAPSRLAVAMRNHSPDALEGGSALHRYRRRQLPGEEYAAQILGLVAAIGEHDDLTRGHSERVQAYAALIGKELGLSGQEAAKLSWAALLHDVGKLRVPSSLLSKPGLPTSKEWDILAAHPADGMEIAQPLREWLGPWGDAIGQHHERWDGGGYPGGLAGTAISEGARIVAVADAYDTITSARSYKRALPASAARAELARCAGDQFDPQVVRAFLAIGLGRLRRIAGPLSLLSAVPGLQSAVPDAATALHRLATTAAAKGAAVVGVALSVSAATAGVALAGGAPTSEPPVPQPTETSAVAPPVPQVEAADLVPAPAEPRETRSLPPSAGSPDAVPPGAGSPDAVPPAPAAPDEPQAPLAPPTPPAPLPVSPPTPESSTVVGPPAPEGPEHGGKGPKTPKKQENEGPGKG
jgi:HD-GYP domain-containing protein (c-di-GMP phosphodiesterase class II)